MCIRDRFVCILLLAFAGWGKLVVYDRWLQGNSIETASNIGAGSKISNRDTLEELKEMAKSDERIQEILKHPEQYPEAVSYTHLFRFHS